MIMLSLPQSPLVVALMLLIGAVVLRTTTPVVAASSLFSSSVAFISGARQAAKTSLSLSSKPLFVDGTVAQQQKAATTATTTQESVQEYYGKILQSSDDLKTNACTTSGGMPDYVKSCLNNIHPDVLSKYYGCGLCIPQYDLTNCNVLDLGCGAGRDVYLLSQLVGKSGTVVGIDMTVEQLNVANQYKEYHADAFGYGSGGNVEFVQGYLENLDNIDTLKKGSFDLIVSNCVINLCTDKEAVLKACYNLLKEGGELYFSDVYSNRRIPEVLQSNPVLWGECLSGALYWNDFQNMAKHCGFADPRLVEDSPISVNNAAVAAVIEQTGNTNLQFYSATYRLQKLTNLEPACEDYGQAVIYKGTIQPGLATGTTATTASTWTLDKHHVFEYGKIHPVCGNTYNMLYGNERIRDHFDFIGNFDKHYGIFEGCGSLIPYDVSSGSSSGSSSSSSSSSSGGGGGCC